MKKDAVLIVIVAITTGLMFYFNPVQPSEINMKLALLCQDHPEIPCEEVISHCKDALQKAQKCYINNQK